VGSSPHAGRRHADERDHGPRAGLIPARGETTPTGRSRTSTSGAHPRTRGDDGAHAIIAVVDTGSSPHAGRRLPDGRQRLARAGLIPARGETTSSSGPSRRPRRAHPRTRGDDGVTEPYGRVPAGSSPHAGRRRRRALCRGRQPGLIPARGETTVSVLMRRPPSGAHPRTRGDDDDVDGIGHGVSGSSPHAGRRRSAELPDALGLRLIPARGETTRRVRTTGSRSGAHPRTRGDDRCVVALTNNDLGSSPHAGRRRIPGRRHPGLGGLIPARGETT